VTVIVALYVVPWANVPDTVGDHTTDTEYWPFDVIEVTGVAPATGAVTPVIAEIVIIALAVSGNSAMTVGLSVVCVTVAPVILKKSAPTPVNVYVDSGVIVIVAVYVVPWANVPDTVGFHETVAEYWPFVAIVVTGVPPAAGAVRGIEDIVMTALAVSGNSAMTVALSTVCVTVAPVTVKKLAPTPINVYVNSGVTVIVAVYSVPWAKVPVTAGDHVIETEYSPFDGIDVTGVPPATGAVKGIEDTDITALAVAGNAAETVALSAEFVADVDPETVKKFAVTPVNVYVDSGFIVIVAVYWVP